MNETEKLISLSKAIIKTVIELNEEETIKYL